MSATKRYTVPTIYPSVDPVSLSDFDIDDIVEYLKSQGREDDDGEGLYVPSADLARIETLLLIGQRESAREYALQIIGDNIGRRL